MSREDKKALKKTGAVMAIFILAMCIWAAFNSPDVDTKKTLSVLVLVDFSESTFPGSADTLKRRLNLGIVESAVKAVKTSGHCGKIAVMAFADRAVRLLPTASFYMQVSSAEANKIEMTLAGWNHPALRSLKRNVTDIASALQFVKDEIGRELDHDDNPAHPRLVLVISDGVNDPQNENAAPENNLTNKPDIDTAVRLLKIKANVQVAMLQLPTAGRMGEYALQKDWEEILGAPYYWKAKSLNEIEGVIKQGMAHSREVNTKIVTVTAQSEFSATSQNVLQGHIGVKTPQLELETDSLCIEVRLVSLAWFSEDEEQWQMLDLTSEEGKRLTRKIALPSGADGSIRYAEPLSGLSAVLANVPIRADFQLNTNWTSTYRKPRFVPDNLSTKSTLTVYAANPDTALISFEFQKELDTWAWAVPLYQCCMALFFCCMALAVWSFYRGGGHGRQDITLTISERNSFVEIYPQSSDRGTRSLKGRMKYIFERLQYAFDDVSPTLVLWPIGDRKIMIEHDHYHFSYKTRKGEKKYFHAFLTDDPGATECKKSHSFFDFAKPHKPLYLVCNDKMAGKISCNECSIQIVPKKNRWFEGIAPWCLDYEHYDEDSRCRLEKISLTLLLIADAVACFSTFSSSATIGQLFAAQWLYWLAIILGGVMYKISVTNLKNQWIALSSLSILVIPSILANLNDLIDLAQRFF